MVLGAMAVQDYQQMTEVVQGRGSAVPLLLIRRIDVLEKIGSSAGWG
jgi:hypothetical protein